MWDHIDDIETILVILALTAIDIVLWFGYFNSKEHADAVAMAAAGIPSGFIGFLSRGRMDAKRQRADQIVSTTTGDINTTSTEKKP